MCPDLLPSFRIICFFIVEFLRVLCIFWMPVLYQIRVLQIVCGLSFHLLNSVSYRAEVLNFNEVHFIFVLMDHALVLYVKTLHQTHVHLDFLLFSGSLTALTFTFRSMNHFELIFLKGS